jgi:poly-gamma-glutamate synthesis protein (capsule biosynthesis protein)
MAGEALEDSNGLPRIRLSALGDLMLSGEWEEPSSGSSWSAFAELAAMLRSDLVFANLETSVEAAEGHIPKAPRVLAATQTIDRALASLGVQIVNLANNHAFDGYLAGFEAVRAILDNRNIDYFGAGEDAAAAARECRTTSGGISLGWLGYTDPDTVPSHVASHDTFGVNLIEPERVLADVARLRSDVDHVIVSLHWGVEYSHFPSPDQIRFARSLIDHGARVVIGHHAHVVQGVERYRDGVIAYNLGNATTTDHYIESQRGVRQTPRTRSSFVLRVTLDKHGVEDVETLPFRSETGKLLVGDLRAARYLARANRNLERGVSPATWKRRRFIEDVILRTSRKLHPSVIRSLRPRHVGKFFRNLFRSLQGLGPAP